MDNESNSVAWLAKEDGSVVLGHGPFENASAPSPDGVSFYIQDFGLQDALPWKIPSSFERTNVAELASSTKEISLPVCDWKPLDAAAFSVVFQEIMAAIHNGVFEKTVPVVAEHGTTAANLHASLFAAMTRQASPLYSYGYLGSESGFAGATPELLFSLRDDNLETMALAGTARSEDRDVFAVDEKEIREHEYVAQTLVSKLLDLGQMERHSRVILDLGSIVHFLTLIRLKLQSELAPEALIRRLHPTPALGPLPRTGETLSLLLNWRDRLGCPAEFGAPFGLWDHGNFHAVVAIRGIWWKKGELILPAGCGIIEASRLVNEWRELRLKREAVKKFLAPS